MPACSTRLTALRATLSMSISFCSSSWVRYSSASGTLTRRFLLLPWNSPGSMSLRLMSTSSTEEPAMISNEGNDFSRDLDLDHAGVEPPLAQLLAKTLAGLGMLVAYRGGILVWSDRTRRWQQDVEQPFLGALCGLPLHFLEPLLANHVHPQLDEVADHRFDIASDVADFGELRGLDLEERRLGQARQPPGDLGLADAGRADHQDVFRRDFLGQLRQQLLPPHPVAERNRDGALGGRLTDHVLVERGDDLARGQRF